MKNNRTVAIIVTSLGLLLAGTAAVVVALSVTQRHVVGWVVTRDVSAGRQLDDGTVHQVTVPQGADDFSVATDSPVGKKVAHSLHSGELLRPSDILTTPTVDVPVSFKLQPGLQPGDTVDIYGPAQGGSAAAGPPSSGGAAGTNSSGPVQLLGRGIIVVTIGSPSVIRVAAGQEQLWISLSFSGTTLVAARSAGLGVSSGNPTSESEALQQLGANATNPGAGQQSSAAPDSPPGDPTPGSAGPSARPVPASPSPTLRAR